MTRVLGSGSSEVTGAWHAHAQSCSLPGEDPRWLCVRWNRRGVEREIRPFLDDSDCLGEWIPITFVARMAFFLRASTFVSGCQFGHWWRFYLWEQVYELEFLIRRVYSRILKPDKHSLIDYWGQWPHTRKMFYKGHLIRATLLSSLSTLQFCAAMSKKSLVTGT